MFKGIEKSRVWLNEIVYPFEMPYDRNTRFKAYE